VTARFAGTSVASLRRVFDWNLFGIRGLSLSRLGWAFAFVAGFALWSTAGNILGGGRPGFCQSGGVDCFASWVPTYTITILPQVLAFTLADNLPLRGVPRLAALGFAAVLAGFSVPLLTCAGLPFQVQAPSCDDLSALTALGDHAGQIVFSSYFACVIAAAYLTRRRDREVAAALHASQLARIDAHRSALEAELHVMQARVEPAFLFDSLRDIAEHYERDRHAGDRLLDQLIQYLRSALPDMRASGSTVAREARLLRAYLGILALRSNGRLDAALHVAKHADDVRMPPMMLVPLITPAAGAPGGLPRYDGSIRIDIQTLDGRLRISVAATGAVAGPIAPPSAVHDVSARLDALYGTRASLAIDRTSADRLLLILELPQ
jgi:hypothetical protein